MKDFSVQTLSKEQIYKFLIGSILPRPIALMTTLSQNQAVNVAPFSFFNMVSYDPPVLSVSIIRNGEETKDTAKNLINQEQAVVHIVSKHLLEDANQASAALTYGQSELERMRVTLVPSTVIQVPGIKEGKVRFETVVKEHVPILDNLGEVKADLFLLEIKHFHFADEILNGNYVDVNQLQPLSRLAGSSYGSIGEIIDLARPQI